MQEQISGYVTEIALALVAIIAVYLRAWLNSLKTKAENYFEQRTTAEQRKTLAILGKEAFSFAETAYREMKGKEKLGQAVLYLQKRADSLGIKVSIEEARAVIEAAWLDTGKKDSCILEVVADEQQQ